MPAANPIPKPVTVPDVVSVPIPITDAPENPVYMPWAA